MYCKWFKKKYFVNDFIVEKDCKWFYYRKHCKSFYHKETWQTSKQSLNTTNDLGNKVYCKWFKK